MDLNYQVKRITDYGEYTAVVAVSRTTKKTTLTLFEGEPKEKIFFNWFKVDMEPINETVISDSSGVPEAIKRMIEEWERPLYQQERAETAASRLEIDHAESLKRERLRLKVEADEEDQEFKVMVHDFIKGTFQMNNDGVTPIKSGYNEKSKQNLKQYQDKKATS